MAEYDMPIEEQVKSIAKELRVLSETMRSGFAGIDKRFDGVDNRLDKLQMLGEQTNAIARLSLEGIEGLRESTNAKFAEAAKTNSEQTELLKSLFVHVRKRVDVIEPKALQRPKTRRRRS